MATHESVTPAPVRSENVGRPTPVRRNAVTRALAVAVEKNVEVTPSRLSNSSRTVPTQRRADGRHVAGRGPSIVTTSSADTRHAGGADATSTAVTWPPSLWVTW